MTFADETRETEITIAADGRIYVFGASRQVIELLRDLQLGDPALDRRARCAAQATPVATTALKVRRPVAGFSPFATTPQPPRSASAGEAELRETCVPNQEPGNERRGRQTNGRCRNPAGPDGDK